MVTGVWLVLAGLLLLVDGHGHAYRAFHAIRGLRSPAGEPTNAIYGFVQTLARLRGGLQPTHGLVVWDGGLAAERVAAWPAYKAQRPPLPEALAAQLDGMVRWCEAAGWPSWCAPGVEADDAIATVARAAERAGARVLIASGDKDFMQLVSERIGLVVPGDAAGRSWSAAEVRAKTGVEPAQVVDWLSLVGDSVDNLPGVAGVGPKTAAALLGRFGSVDGLYANLPSVEPAGLRARLADAEAAVRRNQQLIRLRDDVPGLLPLEALILRPADEDKLAALRARWGFRAAGQAGQSRSGRGGQPPVGPPAAAAGEPRMAQGNLF